MAGEHGSVVASGKFYSVLAVWRGSTATVTTASASMAMEYQDIIQDVEQEEYERKVFKPP